MRKIAVMIESDAAGQLTLAGGPTEDVASILSAAKEFVRTRGGGAGQLLVLTTSGLEKRFKIGPEKQIKSKVK